MNGDEAAMSVGTIFFCVCALVCLVGAIVTIIAKNPIRGAVGLLSTILGIAGLFLKLNAQFLAAIQLIVYAGAVVVLFVFVIMLLGPDAASSEVGLGKARLVRALGGALLLGLAAVTLVLLGQGNSAPIVLGSVGPEHGSVEAVGGLLFTRGIVPFELATALLIVAVVGAIAVARSPRVKKEVKPGRTLTERLFHGPIHPRDAVHTPSDRTPALPEEPR
jgi:NADH-quinone oxidoreductase subunit J